MAAPGGTTAEGAESFLLFCDTFSHQENEEMHLDLISFPRPVAITEVRVIPAGHRVHARISEREKVGETHPQSFKLDLFIRNLDIPGSVAFEKLGTLEYREPSHFQMLASYMAATDVVVLRGWYNRITISLYGFFKEVNTRHPELRPEPKPERPPVTVDPKAVALTEGAHDRPDRAPYPDRGPSRGPERVHERGPPDVEPEKAERVLVGDRTGGTEKSPMAGQKRKSPPASPQTATATVGETTAAKPTTPPGSPREEAQADESASQSPLDELFEPLTPDRSPSNLFMSDEADEDEEQDAYEEIVSEEEEMDDGNFDNAEVQFQGMDLYSEDAWMSVSVSFNPYQCDLSPLSVFPAPDQTEYEVLCLTSEEGNATEVVKDNAQKLLEITNLCYTATERNLKWVESFEELSGVLVTGLAGITDSNEKKDVVNILGQLSVNALDMETVGSLPIAANIRLVKAGLKFVCRFCSCGPLVSDQLISAGIQEALFDVLTAEHTASSMKLLTLQALDCTTDSFMGMEHFLQWDGTTSKELDDNEALAKKERKCQSSGYAKLMEFLLTDQTVRVVDAAVSLSRKVHLYEVLGILQESVNRITESMPPVQELDEQSPKESPKTSPKQSPKTEVDESVKESPEASPKPSIQEPTESPQEDSPSEPPEEAPKKSAEQSLRESPSIKSSDVDVAMETGLLRAAASGDGASFGKVANDDIELIAGAIEEICAVLADAPNLIVQPPVKAFPTSTKITGLDSSARDPCPVVFRLLRSRRLLESVGVLLSSSAVCHPAVYTGIRDLFFILLRSQQGLLFLASQPDVVNCLIRVLTQATETDVHHTEAPPLQEFLRDSNSADSCTAQHLGLLLLYHLQALQAVDQLLTTVSSGLRTSDIDGAETLSTLHTLYSMTFAAIGKAAVVSVLSLEDNLAALLPFVESTGDVDRDAKLKKCVSTRYAMVLILLVVKTSDNVQIFARLAPRFLGVVQRDESDTTATELGHWLAPLKETQFDSTSIPKLVEYTKSNTDSLSTISVARGVLTALRVLRSLSCPPGDKCQLQRAQRDVKWNACCTALFSANGMDIFIVLLTKLAENLLRPWRHGQPLSTGPPLVLVSMATPLLALLKTMLTELLASGTYQFRDRRLMTSLMLLHTVTCSAPMTGQLSGLAQKIQCDIVDLFMALTRPVVQSADHEEAINESVWSLMLKELLVYTTSTPQAFLGGLILLSELLPVPLPLNTLEELTAEEATQVMNQRRLWSAHLNPLSTSLQEILKALAGSACHNLQQVLRRVCSQLADLSAPTAFNIVRTLLETLDFELKKSNNEETKSCSSDAVRIMTLLAYLSSQPAVKISLLQLLKTSGNAKNDDMLFPDLLPSMLAYLCDESDVQAVSRARYCVVSIIQSLCDPSVSLTPFQTPFTDQHLANTLPDKEMLAVICTALLKHVGSEKQSFATILLALRTLVTLTEHNFGVYHLKRALENNSDVFYRLLSRLSSSFESSIPGPDNLSALSTTTELLQLLLPEDPSQVASPPPELSPEEATLKRTTEISVTADQMKTFLKLDSPQDSLLLTLEKRLEESCKEDETLEPLLDGITGLKQTLEVKGEDSASKVQEEQEEISEPVLPSSQPLQLLFSKRMTFLVGDVSGLGHTLWYSTPPPEDIDPEVDLVKSDLEVLREKYCSDFDLKAELEKGLASSSPSTPPRKKTSRLKRKFDPLISGPGRDAKRFRGRGRGRGMARGRGNPRMNDLFRSRKQNTSRPPSMHVDDFVAMEQHQAKVQESPPMPMRRSGSKGPPMGRPMDRSPGGFMGNQARWGNMSPGLQRKGPGMDGVGSMRVGGPPWISPRQQEPFSGFPGQRGFQRGLEWNQAQPPQPYRGGGLRDDYNRPQGRGGYWGSPKPMKDDSRFMPPPNVGGYRPGMGRGYQGRHLRSFTR